MNNDNMNNAEELQAFNDLLMAMYERGMEKVTKGEYTQDALDLVREYYGSKVKPESYLTKIMEVYLMGVNTGLEVYSAIDSESSQNASEDGDREDIG